MKHKVFAVLYVLVGLVLVHNMIPELELFVDLNPLIFVLSMSILGFLSGKFNEQSDGVRIASSTALSSGFIATLIGLVLTLGQPELDFQIFAIGLSVSVLPLFYGLLLFLLLIPFRKQSK
ncbi:hypothetical protein VINI7043_10180 [Vibrio nigripulchritudo ATCC 27043]|uniref:hypothetical protein n=1 Tax=Vibrio nigripulchritudo TaxID=28173 RepID=UPI00021C1828|nr:hypothetical protein [Vibrio nigripulchritudo]EGU59962.1 hypothetical protein VINI7043_10180 [Vibrio nigripulchritudo ATCC 27043]